LGSERSQHLRKSDPGENKSGESSHALKNFATMHSKVYRIACAAVVPSQRISGNLGSGMKFLEISRFHFHPSV